MPFIEKVDENSYIIGRSEVWKQESGRFYCWSCSSEMCEHSMIAGKIATYDFESHDYVKFMPVVDTNQFSGRLHRCPICRSEFWSCFGHADKHWQSHYDLHISHDQNEEVGYISGSRF